MSDHLTDARTCVTHASKARDAGSAISWLTDACKQIIAYLESQQAPPAAQQGDGGPWTPDTEDVEFCLDYLEAQNAPQEATSADLPASQPGSEQLGGSDFMDWMADRLADPEVRAGYLAAHAREVRAQVAGELIPVVAHKGPNDTDLSLLDEAAHKLEHGYSFGSNVTAAVVRLIRNAIHIARQEQP